MSRLGFRLLALILGSPILNVATATAGEVRKDALGDPLPPGALARLGTVRLRHAGSVTMLGFSPDGKRLLSRGNNTLCLWSTATGEQLRRQMSDSSWISGTFTAEGDALFLFHDKTGIHLTDLATGKRLRTIPLPDKPIRDSVLTPNGKYLGVVVGEGSGLVHIWETATAKEIAKFTIAHPGFAPLFFSADGTTLVEVDYESDIRIRATVTGKVLGRIPGVKRTELSTLALSPDGKKLATGGDNHVVHVWDTTTGKEQRSWQQPSASLTFSPDGKTLASASQDTTVLVWDVADLNSPKRLRKDLATKQMEELWARLGQSDAGQAYQAIGTLVDAKQTVSFLRQRLHPIRVAVNRQQMDKLIADLDSDQFEARERATAELTKLGGVVEPALRKAIASRPPLEVRRRIEDLLDRLDHHVLSREDLRGLRAVETLEHIGSMEAQRVLATLARGTPGFRLTEEARDAVERLSRRRAVNP